jgi:hypothetical protein
MRSFAVVVCLVSASAAVAVSALASPRRLVVAPATVSPGGVVHVSGNASPCAKGSTVFAISAAFPGKAYGQGTLTGRVAAHGAFSFRGHVRRTLEAGRYVVTARCGGGNLGVTATIRVR